MADDPTNIDSKKTNDLLTKIEDIERKALEDQIATHDEEQIFRDNQNRHQKKTVRDAKDQQEIDKIVAENSEKIAELTKRLKEATDNITPAVEETTAAVSGQTEADKKEAELLKLRGERDKEKRDKQKISEMNFLNKLEELGIHDAEIQDDMLKDFNKGIVLEDEQLQRQAENLELVKEREKKDDQEKREVELREEERQATNLRTEEVLSAMYERLGLDAELADRIAKRQMQMKESVHKWWEDKKKGFKKMGSSMLEWLLKGAGILLLWKLFDFLSKTNLKELYEMAVTAFDFLWQGMKTLGAWVGGIKVFKWIDDFFGKSKGWKAFKDFWKGIGGKITKAFKDFKISGLITKVVNLFKAGGKIFKLVFGAFGGGASLKVWDGIITAIKGVFKMITGPFGKEGGIGKAFANISKFLQMIPGMKTITKFAGGVLKFMGRLFAPVMLVWGIVESIMAGFGAAEEETGGLGQKILTFLQVGLQTLLDFFIFDLAQMVEDGIKWGIKWVMGLFGFSEAEQKAATDWSIVGAVKDAIFKAIDWVRNLFRFDGKGISFKELAPLVDIILFPLNAAFKWLSSLFGWDTDKDGKKKKDWSIGGLITSALDNIFKWLGSIFDIDFAGIVSDMLGGLGKAGSWLAGKLGLGPDTKESLQEEIDELTSANEKMAPGVTTNRRKKVNLDKIKELQSKMEKLSTGGTILPGGAAIVGEGSMGGELVVNAASTAKVIPASQTADIMSGMSGGQNFAPTTIVNSAPASTTMVANSSSHNPYSDKYFRN